LIEDIDKTLQAIQDIAIHLNWNLHSGARENIVSSLLAASINQSDKFRKWFLDQIHFNKKFRGSLYAVPNTNIKGSVVRAIQKQKEFEDKKFPERPDIAIFGNSEEKEWLEGSETKKDLSDALRSIHMVVIEVKHTGLTPGDDDKYNNLIKGLASYNKKNKKRLLNRHRFVIVSSHTPKAKTTIIGNGGRNIEENKWYSYFKRDDDQDGVKHFTLREILEKIQEINIDNTQAQDKCRILQMFEYYLEIHLGIPHLDKKLHNQYWNQVIKGSGSVFDLKWSIADHVSWLAGNASVKTERKRREDEIVPSWHEDKASRLKKIEFKRDERHGSTVRFEYNQNSCKYLKIVLNGYTETLDVKKMNNYREIIKILNKVIEFIEN